jgi:hypothetical protein
MKLGLIENSPKWFDADQATAWVWRGSWESTIYRTRKGQYVQYNKEVSMPTWKGKKSDLPEEKTILAQLCTREEAVRWFMVADIVLPSDLLPTMEELEV